MREKPIRAVAAILIALLILAPAAAHPQAAGKVARIGVLWHAGNEEEEKHYLTALRQGFRDLGYAEGRTLVLENRYAGEQYERFNAQAAELVSLGVDVLVAVTRSAAAAAQRATATIPIVFVVVPDPVGMKFVASLARPGGNITGVTQMATDIIAKRIEFFKEAVPGLSRVAMLVNPADPVVARLNLDQARAAATHLGIAILPIEVRVPADIPAAFVAIDRAKVDGVATGIDPLIYNERKLIAELARARRLPTMVHIGEMVDDGSLMSYAPNYPALFRRAAAYVDKILKGAKPADLPVEQPTKFDLVVNLKTARAIGLVLPPSILLRADRMID